MKSKIYKLLEKRALFQKLVYIQHYAQLPQLLYKILSSVDKKPLYVCFVYFIQMEAIYQVFVLNDLELLAINAKICSRKRSFSTIAFKPKHFWLAFFSYKVKNFQVIKAKIFLQFIQ